MADKKLKIALCGGVAAVVILMILLLSMCGGQEAPEPTEPVQTEMQTEPTQAPETQPPTEAPTEPATEPATEPTEPEETQATVSGSSKPGGYNPSFGQDDDDEDETTKETEPFEAPAAGAKSNPYIEKLSGVEKEISTVNLKSKESVYYEIHGAGGSVLLLEASDVSLTVGETAHKPGESGTITLPVEAEPLTLQITNDGAADAVYKLRFASRGSAENPEKLESIASVKVELAAGNEDGYHYIWTATDTCPLTLMPGKTGYRIEATCGDITASNGESADGSLTLDVTKGAQVRLQVTAAADEEGKYPAVSDVITGTIPEKGSEKNPIELQSLTPDALELTGGEDHIRYYSWVSEMSGTFAVQITAAEPETVACGVALNGETTLAAAASAEVAAQERVLIRVETAADETGAYPAVKITFACTFTATPGLEANPIEINTAGDSIDVPAGKMIYYKAAAPGMEMTLTGENLRVYVGGISYEPAEGKTVVSCGSDASMVFAVANLGEEDATYGISFETIPVTPPASEPEESQPEESQPEESQPEESQPEESEPEESQPEESQPEESQPEESQPEESQPEESQPEESQPEESEPEESQPEESEPSATDS